MEWFLRLTRFYLIVKSLIFLFFFTFIEYSLIYNIHFFQAKTAEFIGVDPLGDRPKKVKDKVLLLPAGMSKKPSARTRSLKLSEITTSLPPEQKTRYVFTEKRYCIFQFPFSVRKR